MEIRKRRKKEGLIKKDSSRIYSLLHVVKEIVIVKRNKKKLLKKDQM